MSAVATIREARAEGLRPDTLLTVSQWADAHRLLPKKSSAEPGPWRTDRTPYLREIMDCLSATSDVEEVVFIKAAQIGGSEAILNALGYVIDHSPGPVILVQPTVDLAKRFSRQRLEPLVTVTPRIAAKVAPARSRDSGNTVLAKDFPGGQLIITGANSAVGLRSMPAQYALCDEIDGYPIDVDDEGSPLALVEARQRTFSRRKLMKVSTPTIAGVSAIEAAYLASDQRRYYVPCPDCGERQPLEFKQLKWTEFGLPPEQAVYVCRACDYQIREHQKTAMLAGGEWVPEAPDRIGKVRGYHLNALYAPVGWMSWGDIASQFVKVHRQPEKYRVFVNTVLGETWQESGEAPDWQRLYDRREGYQVGACPAGVLFLTAAADVQKDRIIYEVVGWGREKESWSIDVGIFSGDIYRPEPWADLDALLARSFQSATGVPLRIARLAVDSGNFTQTVYNWTRKYSMSQVIAVKGFDHVSVLIGAPSAVDITINGRKLKRGAKMWPVGVSLAKSELYGWLKLDRPTDESLAAGVGFPPGFCHFPEHGEDYFKQLTGEQYLAKKLAWIPVPGRENHWLDCRVYARAAAALVGLDRFKESDWARLERSMGLASPSAPRPVPATPAPATQSSSVAPPRRPGWIQRPTGWLRRN